MIGAVHAEIGIAADLLLMVLSMSSWKRLTMTCGWSQEQHLDAMKSIACRPFVKAE